MKMFIRTLFLEKVKIGNKEEVNKLNLNKKN